MDLDLDVKQLADKFGVCEQAITNLEMNRNQPRTSFLKAIVTLVKPHLNGLMSEQELWKLCFKNNLSYPKQQNSFGDKLRSARMQNFLSINQLALKLGVDPTSIGKWERLESNPITEYKNKILDWINSNKSEPYFFQSCLFLNKPG
jgi:transcriptional regulator with XRE-family HTH domain